MVHKKNNIPFNKGDKVVYPKHGVGYIETIEDIKIQEQTFKALSIVTKATGVKFIIPLDKASDLGLRHIYNENDMICILEILSSKKELESLSSAPTWKERKKILDDLFASGELENLVQIVKYLYIKNQEKPLPNSERRVYDFSLKFLVDEISEIKRISKEESEHLIAETLVKSF